MHQDAESAGIEECHVAEVNDHLRRLFNLAQFSREKVRGLYIQLALHSEDGSALGLTRDDCNQGSGHGLENAITASI